MMKMHGLRILIIALGMAYLIAACGGGKNTTESSPSVEINSPTNDSRMDLHQTELSVVSIKNKTAVPVNFGLKQVGLLSSPVIENKTLQATDVKVHGSYAFVSYNFQGSEQMGAVDMIDISKPEKPVLKSEMLFKDRDVNAIDISDKEIFIVGAMQDERDGPAYLSKISYEKGVFAGELKSVAVPGFAGTGVLVHHQTIFVSSGDQAGVFGFRAGDLEMILQENIRDARALASESEASDSISVLTGRPAELFTYETHASNNIEKPTFDLISHYRIDGAMTAEAKSTLQLGRSYALASQGEKGFSFICRESGEILSSQAVEKDEMLLSEDLATNSVTTVNGVVLAANGGGGLMAYQAKVDSQEKGCHEIQLSSLGKIDFGEGSSANHVYSNGKVIFVASGRGGLRILNLKIAVAIDDLIDFDAETLPATTEFGGIAAADLP